jgi:hypothetical protein
MEGEFDMSVETSWKASVWPQFGAAIDMLENAMDACPYELWSDRTRKPEFWYLVYHTLFFLDLYLSDSVEEFVPQKPFTLSELDPAGVLPERVYSKEEIRTFFDHCRSKCKAAIESLTDERGSRRCGFAWVDCTVAELFLYNMRHVQHGAAQLNLILRQETNSAPEWVRRRQG